MRPQQETGPYREDVALEDDRVIDVHETVKLKPNEIQWIALRVGECSSSENFGSALARFTEAGVIIECRGTQVFLAHEEIARLYGFWLPLTSNGESNCTPSPSLEKVLERSSELTERDNHRRPLSHASEKEQ
jgi:hypothetical protein